MSVAFSVGFVLLVWLAIVLLASVIFGPATRVPCARGCGARVDLDADKQLAHDRACPNNGLAQLPGVGVTS